MKKFLFIFLAFSLPLFCVAQDAEVTTDSLTEEEAMAMYQAYIDSVSNSLNYQTGTIVLKDGLATLAVPEGYKYIGVEESNMVLTELWGNPPSPEGEGSLGMLFPTDSGPNDMESYAINITYSEEGYIDDADAKDLDYDDLLATMQEDTEAANEMRASMGYGTVELVGWASEPYYDAAEKKLHWAKNLRFDGSSDHTLNYNIRVLGRRGYLELNAISGLNELEAVKAGIPDILPAVAFNQGHRYVDFDPQLDKVAAYGIGGLIAGKVLAKAGILAKLGLILAKFWKLIAVGVIAFFAGIRKLFGGKDEEQEVA